MFELIKRNGSPSATPILKQNIENSTTTRDSTTTNSDDKTTSSGTSSTDIDGSNS